MIKKKPKMRNKNKINDEMDDSENPSKNKLPFTQKELNDIFKISPQHSDIVISRESSSLEFKESFGWKSLPKYLKTCASFANTKGGYIVFGVADRPHRLEGLTGANLNLFEGIAPEKLTGRFNEQFSPEILWDIQEYQLNGKIYGILFIYESRNKPVVCIKNLEKDLKEGDIYYRYRARSERIKYPELRSILDYGRKNEQRLWMKHLLRMARIGVRDVGVFDFNTGQVTGTHGSFLIDESLVSQLNFINEGDFSEARGTPTLKLIGNVEPISNLPTAFGKKHIVKIKGIRISDIILGFVNLEKVQEPLEYIKQICFESTAFLPVYYYIHLGNQDTASTIELIKKVVSRSPSKDRLIGRLQNRTTQSIAPPQGLTGGSSKRLASIINLNQQDIDQGITGMDLVHCLQAMRSLSQKDVKQKSKYVRALLKAWFVKYYSSANSTLADNLRRAICWIDECLYMPGNE